MKPKTVVETYDYLRRIAPDFTRRIAQAAAQAHNEAEFEREMNNAIAGIAEALGVGLLFRQQYTLATGRADAVYNRFIIEYENPGTLRPNLSQRRFKGVWRS